MVIMEKVETYPRIVARFYDVIYHQLRSSTDSEYFVNQVCKAAGPVLEVGVGTGRLFRQALDRGADIYGIDSSVEMIEALRSQTEAVHHSRVRVQDIRSMDLEQQFALIVAPFRVFAHLTSIDDQLRALDAVHHHLRPGGLFIFDLFVPNLKMLDQGIDRMLDFDGEYEEGKKLQRYTSMNADLSTQLSHVTMEFVWDGEEGRQQTESWQFALRFFFRFELENLIALSPMQLEAIHGDYGEGKLSADSKDYLVVCRRPEQLADLLCQTDDAEKQ